MVVKHTKVYKVLFLIDSMIIDDEKLLAALIALANSVDEPFKIELTATEGVLLIIGVNTGRFLYKSSAEYRPFKLLLNEKKPIDILSIIKTHNLYPIDQSQDDDAVIFSELPHYKELENILSDTNTYGLLNQLSDRLKENDLGEIGNGLYMSHPVKIDDRYIGSIFSNPENKKITVDSYNKGYEICDYVLM